jgi:peptide/nickel transport system permease protein
MGLYALKRLGAVVIVLTLMSVLVFLATHALPSNTAQLILGQYSTPETQAALEHKLGLDLPLTTQYWRWADGVLHGDLGQSLVMERPVAPVLWEALSRSAVLALSAMAVVTVLGPALGVIAAVNQGRWIDHTATVFTYVGISVPEFYWGLVLILLFGSTFHLLPTSGAVDLSDGVLSYVAHLVLPVITLTLALLAHVSRLTRSSMLEALDSNYVKVARARGMPERVVILRHALRNALLPTITVVASLLGYLAGGLVVIETLFHYRGIGALIYSAARAKDFPMLEAGVLTVGAVYALASVLADLLSAALNPRLRAARA